MRRNTYHDGSPLEFGNPEHIKYVQKMASYFDEKNPAPVTDIDIYDLDVTDTSYYFCFTCPICNKRACKQYDFEGSDDQEEMDEEIEYLIKSIAKKPPCCTVCGQTFLGKKDTDGYYSIYCKHPKK